MLLPEAAEANTSQGEVFRGTVIVSISQPVTPNQGAASPLITCEDRPHCDSGWCVYIPQSLSQLSEVP